MMESSGAVSKALGMSMNFNAAEYRLQQASQNATVFQDDNSLRGVESQSM